MKIKKSISLLLCFSLIIACFSSLMLNLTASAVEPKPIYYVAPGGTGDGKTLATAAGSIDKVIQTINAEGYANGDEVVVCVDGTNQPNYWNSDSQNSLFIPYSNQQAHTCKITYTSLDYANHPAKLCFNYNASTGKYVGTMYITGPSVFKDIYLVDGYAKTNDSYALYTQGHDVTLDNVKLCERGTSTTGFVDRYGNGGKYTWTYMGMNASNKTGLGNGGRLTYADAATFDCDENIFMSSCLNSTTVAGNSTSQMKNLSNDVTLEINGGTKKHTLHIARTAGAYVTFEKNVNLVVNKGTVIDKFTDNHIDFNLPANRPFIKGAIQMVLNDGSSIKNNEVEALAFYTSSAKDTLTPKYIMKSASGSKGSLDVTETAGTYKVNGDAYAYVIANEKIYYGSKSLNLRVPAEGTYDVKYADSLDEIKTTNFPDVDKDDWVESAPGVLSKDGDQGGNYMLHVDATGGSAKPLQKTAELEKGKTYVATFKYKILKGELDKDFYFYVSKAQQVVENVTGKGTPYFFSQKGQFDSVSTVDGFSQLEYTFTLNDRSDVTFQEGISKYDIGFYFESGKKSEIYVADFAVYEKDDTTKRNKLLVPGYSKGMYGWHSDYYTAAENSDTYSTSAYTAKYVAYNASYFELELTGNYMLHAKGEGASAKVLQKTAELTKGKTYTISFKYKLLKGELDKSIYLMVSVPQPVINANNANKGKTYFSSHLGNFDSVTKSDEYSEISYTFKFEDKSHFPSGVTVPEGKSQVDIGFYFESNRATEVYIADFVVYENDDTSKKNLLLVPDYSKGLYGWHSDYYIADEDALTFETSAYKLDYVKYDDSYFKLEEIKQSMMHVTSTGASAKPLQKTAELTKGHTYTVNIKYVMKSGVFDEGVYFYLSRPQQVVENATGKGKIYFSSHLGQFEKAEYNDATLTATYTFKFEDKSHMGVSVPDGKSKVDLGFYFESGKKVEMYVADFTIFDTSDTNKTNLLLEPDFAKGLYGWHSDYYSAVENGKKFENSAYVAECLDYDESIFKRAPSAEYPEQICYFKNGSGSETFATTAKVTVGKTYYFECSIASQNKIAVYASTTGNRDTFIYSAPIVEQQQYDDYIHAVYKITIPEKAPNGAKMTESIFVGLSLPSNVSGYVFDISFYDSEDPTKKELLSNPKFKLGLDNYVFGWKAWFVEGRQGLGVREWTNGAIDLKLIDYDLTKIIQYTDDSRFNDGVWWNPKDLPGELYLGSAIVKGYLKNNQGNVFSNTKLYLASANNEYNVKTNSKGWFEFLDVIPDFYELFTVDADGNKYSTGFFGNIDDKDVYNLSIVCNNVQNDIAGDAQQDTTAKVPKGALKANLYTPDRKPVVNCKVYLRNIGEITTDTQGYFEFIDVPVGTYDLYTITDDGSELLLKKVTIKDNIELQLKLKYDTGTKKVDVVEEKGMPIFVYFIIAGAVIIMAGGLAIFFGIKAKKRKN